jgi:orotidine-5'-phosphate decarboxylase
MLVPGIGAQSGDPEKVIRAGGTNILINVGRDIIYSANPRRKSEEYCQLFRRISKECVQNSH